MTRRPLLTLAVLAALTTSACGSVDEEAVSLRVERVDVPGWTVPSAPALEPARRVPGRPFLQSVDADVRPVVLRDEETTVLVGADRLTAWSSASGEEAWDRSFTDGVCAADGIDDGLVAVLGGAEQTFGPCTRVTLVDARTGDVVWRRDLRSAADVTQADLTLGDAVVLVGGDCGEVNRLDTATGRALAPIAPADDGCDHRAGFGDDAVAVWEDPVTGAEDESPTDGRFLVVDADSGTRLWQRPAGSDDTGLDGVVATDPLVLDVTERGHRTLRLYDDEGRPGPYVGKRLDAYAGASVRARSGEVIVLSYSRPGTYAYDLTTGEELWRVLPTPAGDRVVVGADTEGRLVWLRTVEVPGDGGGTSTQRQVLRSPADDPSALELVGSLPQAPSASPVVPDGVALSGDDLVVGRADSAEVVPLPEESAGPAAEVVTSQQTRTTVLGADDLRATDLAEVCDAVDPAVLAPLGLSPDLPTPADCHWLELADPEDVERELRVAAEASTPDPTPATGEESLTADQVAAARLRELRAADEGPGRWRDVPGLGDEAVARSWGLASGEVSSVDLLVRSRNVVLTVSIDVEALLDDGFASARSLDLVERTALRVASDVLRSLDRPTEPVPGPAEGEPAPDACGTAGPASDEVVTPGTRGRDLSPDDDQLSRCLWRSTEGDRAATLDVTAHAVGPGALPGGGDAPEVAAGLRAIGRAWEPAGEGGRLWTFRASSDYVTHQVTLRRGGLVVTVTATLDGAPVPDDLARAALRVGRRVLNTTTR